MPKRKAPEEPPGDVSSEAQPTKKRLDNASEVLSKAKRPNNFWAPFNTWWQDQHDVDGKRPTADQIRAWHADNAHNVWPADQVPTVEDTENHAKGKRTPEKVRAYFKTYRTNLRARALAQQQAAATHFNVQDALGQYPSGALQTAAALAAAALLAAPPQPPPGTAPQPADPSEQSGSGQPAPQGSFMDLLMEKDAEDEGVVGGYEPAAVAAGHGSRIRVSMPPCPEGGDLCTAAAGMAQGTLVDVPHATWPPLASPLQQQLPESQPATPAKAALQRSPFGRTGSSNSLDTEGQAYSGCSAGGGSSSGGGDAYSMMLPQSQPQLQGSVSPWPASPAQHVALSPSTTLPPPSYSPPASPAPHGLPFGRPPPANPTRSSTRSPSPGSEGGAPYGRYNSYPYPYPGYSAHSSWGGSPGHAPATAPATGSYTQGGAPAAASPAGYTYGPESHGGASSDSQIPSVPGSPHLPYSPTHSDAPSPVPADHVAHGTCHSQTPYAVPPPAGRPPLPPRPYGPDQPHGGAAPRSAARRLCFPYPSAGPAMPPHTLMPRYCVRQPYGGAAASGPRPAPAPAELPGASPQHDGYACQQQYHYQQHDGYGYQQQYHYTQQYHQQQESTWQSYHQQQQEAAWQYYVPPPPPPQPQWSGAVPYWPAAQQVALPPGAYSSSTRDAYGTITASAAAGPTAAQHVGAGPVAPLPPATAWAQLDVPDAAVPCKGTPAVACTGREAGPDFTFPTVTDEQRPGTPTLLPTPPPSPPPPQQQLPRVDGVLQAPLGQPAAAPPAADLKGLGGLPFGLQSGGEGADYQLRNIGASGDMRDLPMADDDFDPLSLLSD